MDTKENIETAETEERKPRRNWKESKVIFLVLPIILTILVPLGGFSYLCGRLNFHLALVVVMIYPVTGVFIVICFLGGIVRFFRDWSKSNKKGKCLIITQTGIPIVFVALFVIPFFIPIGSDLWFGKAFNHGFRDRIRSKADIGSIRDWMRTLSKEEYEDFSVRLPRDEWPKPLKVLNPNSITLLADKNANPQVRMMWGAAVFHWGVAIGMQDMVIPPTEISEWTECWLLVEPGVYVWDQG